MGILSTLGIKTGRAACIEVPGICNITDATNDGVMRIAGVFIGIVNIVASSYIVLVPILRVGF